MKKFIIVMVTLLLAFSLVGCGEDNTNSTVTNTPGLEQGTPDTKPDSTTPPVDTSGAVKIEFPCCNLSKAPFFRKTCVRDSLFPRAV